jgi:hypothetical protein
VGKGEECDKVVRKLMKKWKQIAPDKQFRYFRKRFQGTGKEVLLITGLDNITEIDPFLVEAYKDEEFNKIVEKWHSCIGNSNKPFYWQEKFTIE